MEEGMCWLRAERRGARWWECTGSEAIICDAFCPICASGSMLGCSFLCFLRPIDDTQGDDHLQQSGTHNCNNAESTKFHTPHSSKHTTGERTAYSACTGAGHSGANALLTVPGWWERFIAGRALPLLLLPTVAAKQTMCEQRSECVQEASAHYSLCISCVCVAYLLHTAATK